LGVIKRYMAGERRYEYPEHVSVSSMLFNYHEATPTAPLVLTEGATDTIASWDVGYQACAALGSRFTERQARLVRRLGVQDLFFAGDMDQAGDAFHTQVWRALPDVRIHRLTWDRKLGKDLSALPSRKRKQILSNAIDPWQRAA
jgi:hypothetical protein